MTLVEILVVLAIVGVAGGAVVLSLGAATRDDGPRVEAFRLVDRLRLAADEALITGRPLVLTMEPGAYAFGGAAPETEALAGRHVLADGVRLASVETPVLAIDPDGAADPLDIEFRGGGAAWSVRFDGLNARATPVAGAAS